MKRLLFFAIGTSLCYACTYGNHTYQLPVDYVEMKTEALSDAIHQLETLYPSLQDMPCTDYHTLLQISFIASEINGNEGLCYAKCEPSPNPEALENCLNSAQVEYTRNVAKLSCIYVTGVIMCGGTAFAAMICYSFTTTAYYDALQDAKATYETEVRNCHLRHG